MKMNRHTAHGPLYTRPWRYGAGGLATGCWIFFVAPALEISWHPERKDEELPTVFWWKLQEPPALLANLLVQETSSCCPSASELAQH